MLNKFSMTNAQILPFTDHAIEEAARLILAGEPVAVPTETVYGLAADATNGEAVARIYEAKGRPSFNPLIVHVPDVSAALRIGAFSEAALELAHAHWPGPLTLVVPLRPEAGIASIVTPGLPSVGLRVRRAIGGLGLSQIPLARILVLTVVSVGAGVALRAMLPAAFVAHRPGAALVLVAAGGAFSITASALGLFDVRSLLRRR